MDNWIISWVAWSAFWINHIWRGSSIEYWRNLRDWVFLWWWWWWWRWIGWEFNRLGWFNWWGIRVWGGIICYLVGVNWWGFCWYLVRLFYGGGSNIQWRVDEGWFYLWCIRREDYWLDSIWVSWWVFC